MITRSGAQIKVSTRVAPNQSVVLTHDFYWVVITRSGAQIKVYTRVAPNQSVVLTHDFY